MHHFCLRAGALSALLISASAYAQTPTPAQREHAAAVCVAAMQVIGHDGEAVIEQWNIPDDSSPEALDADINLAEIAGILVKTATRIATDRDEAYCQKIVDKLDRLYSPSRDKSDHMSPTRIGTVIGMLRITAASKAQLEAMANRNISH